MIKETLLKTLVGLKTTRGCQGLVHNKGSKPLMDMSRLTRKYPDARHKNLVKEFLNWKSSRVILSWAACYWFPSIHNSNAIIESWLNQIQLWHKNSGDIWTISHIKNLKLIYTRYIGGEPFHVFPGRIGLLSSGLPRGSGSIPIKEFNKLILEGKNEHIQFVLTLLSISRVLSGQKDPDLSTITDESKADPSLIERIGEFIPVFMKENAIFPNNTISWTPEDIRLSNKAGPEGRATLFSWRDAVLLTDDMMNNIKILSEELHKYLTTLRERRSIQKVVNAHILIKHKFSRLDYKQPNADSNARQQMVFTPYDEAIRAFYKEHPDGLSLRKLSVVNDPEAKARIIAILDFWSQEILNKIHQTQFDILKFKLPQDRTFTQDPHIINKPEGNKYHSLDLTAATDRFPIKLQEKVMAYLYDEDKAKAWKSLLIDTPFSVPWLKPGSTVMYNSGQPMGAYSSWSTFAITHHLTVAYAAKLAGIERFEQYILLGDDIVIYNDLVAEKYVEVMHGLGVDISLHKTHTSSSTYEFAKRWFHNGIEITGIQVKGFMEVSNKYHLLYANVMNLYDRALQPRIPVDIPHLILNLLKRLGYYSRVRSNLSLRIRGLHAFTKFIRDDNLEGIVQHIKEKYGDRWYHLPTKVDDLNHFILSNIYTASTQVIQAKTRDAMNYEVGLFKELYPRMAPALADGVDMWTSSYWLILMSPITMGVRNRLKALAKSFTSIENGSVKDMVQAIALPDPSMFQQRRSTEVMNTSAELANKFFNQIEEHIQQRPPHYQENMSGTMAHTVYNRLNGMLLNEHKYRTYGLIA